MAITLYTIARQGESGRFLTIGELMTSRSFVNRLIQDGVRHDEAGTFARDVELAALTRPENTSGVTHSQPFTRGFNGARYRVIGTRVETPEIPQED